MLAPIGTEYQLDLGYKMIVYIYLLGDQHDQYKYMFPCHMSLNTLTKNLETIDNSELFTSHVDVSKKVYFLFICPSSY